MEALKSKLRLAVLPAEMATERALLPPPLKALAIAVEPEQFLLDCGGAGQCGPNTSALLLGLVGLFDGDGLRLRKRVCKHARESGVLDALTPFCWAGTDVQLTARELCVESMKSWPLEFQQGLEPNAEAYLSIVEQKEAWTDLPFLLLKTDCFEVISALTGVNDLSDIFPMPVLGPLRGQEPKAWLDYGCWVNRHFLAIVNTMPKVSTPPVVVGEIPAENGPSSLTLSAGLRALLVAAKGRGLSEAEQEEQREQNSLSWPFTVVEEERQELDSFCWPLTSVEEVKRLLQCKFICPRNLIAMEFSSAMKIAYRKRDQWVLTADKRAGLIAEMHYQGDIRDILELQLWQIIWFYPNCFQQLRGDVDCIEFKKFDHRAYWGIAVTIFCLCCKFAKAVAVEQPQTIAPDYIDMRQLPATSVTEFHTDQWGDSPSKFVRLTTRNLRLPAPSRDTLHRSDPERSQWVFKDADARDRARSSWAGNPKMCDALASAELIHDAFPPMLVYAAVILLFAKAWEAAGLPVPVDFDNADAQPTDVGEREYLLRRGTGDGRVPPFCSVADRVVGPITEETDAGSKCDEQQLCMGEAAEDVAEGCSLSIAGNLVAPSGNVCQSTQVDEAMCGMHAASRCSLSLTGKMAAPNDDPRLRSLRYGEAVGVAEHQLSEPPLIDLRAAVATTAILVYTCILIQPVVLAHANGFSVIGFEFAEDTPRSTTASAIQRLCSKACQGASLLAFMVGEYGNGHRLFTAPVEVIPQEAAVCRTKSQRLKRLAAGATLVWCALAALTNTPAYDSAARALLACSAFAGPSDLLADAANLPGTEDTVVFSIGKMRETSVIRRPLLHHEAAPARAQSLALSSSWEQLLRTALETTSDARLDGWLDGFKPLPVEEVPTKLWDALSDWSDPRIDTYPLPKVTSPHVLPWRPLPPNQEELPSEAPACPQVSDLYLTEGWAKITEWLEAARLDMISMTEQLAKGVPPAQVKRDLRPAAIAVGDAERVSWARRRIFDCRSRCCTLLDFDAPFSSDLNLEAYAKYLAEYPDQTLVANILEGVTLDADVELQSLMVSHVSSITNGFTSVGEEIRRLKGLSYLDLFAQIAYSPFILNGQGAAVRAGEDRARRTVEAGGPRNPTYDASGLQAISINAASHIHHIPQYFLQDERPEFHAWIDARGLRSAFDEAVRKSAQDMEQCPAVSSDIARGEWLDAVSTILGSIGDDSYCWIRQQWGDVSQRSTKWVKEVKPTLAGLAEIITVLRRAAHFLGQPIYIWTDDLKDMFNQLGLATSELWKQGAVFLHQPGDLPEVDLGPGALVFISERRLGFGTHGASNIAQRWDDANLEIFRDRMDEWEAAQPISPRLEEWLHIRRQVQEDSGERGHCTRRWHARAEPASEEVDGDPCPLGGVLVQPQLRLYGSVVYSDDVAHVAVGVKRTLAQMSIWRDTVTELKLKMAKPEKRALGTWVKWLGIIVIVSLGALVIPSAKLVRARCAIGQVMQNTCNFGDYRSLIGLLEHFRCVNLQSRQVMHGLYEPHGPEGASREGPGGMVICSPLMQKQLMRWLVLVLQSAGVSTKRAVLRERLEPMPSLRIIMDSDACHGDESISGMAGFCHGYWWYFPVPKEHMHLVYTAFLEFLAFVFNILVFEGVVAPQGVVKDISVLGRTDALTTALTLPGQSQRSPLLMRLFQYLIGTEAWKRISGAMTVMHIFGNCNPLSDYPSRAKMREFQQLCNQLGIRPTQLPVPQEAIDIYLLCIHYLQAERKRAKSSAPCGDSIPDRMDVSLAPCGMVTPDEVDEFDPASPPPSPVDENTDSRAVQRRPSRAVGLLSAGLQLQRDSDADAGGQKTMIVGSGQDATLYFANTRYYAQSVADLPDLDARHEWREFKCLCNGYGHNGPCCRRWWKVALIGSEHEASDMCNSCGEAWFQPDWRCRGDCTCAACMHPNERQQPTSFRRPDYLLKALEQRKFYEAFDPLEHASLGGPWPEPGYRSADDLGNGYERRPADEPQEPPVDPSLPWSLAAHQGAYGNYYLTCACDRLHFDGKPCQMKAKHGSLFCEDCSSRSGSCNQPPESWVKCSCAFCGEGGCHFLVPPPPEFFSEGYRSLCFNCAQRDHQWSCECNCSFTAPPSKDMELGEIPPASGHSWCYQADNPFSAMCCGAIGKDEVLGAVTSLSPVEMLRCACTDCGPADERGDRRCVFEAYEDGLCRHCYDPWNDDWTCGCYCGGHNEHSEAKSSKRCDSSAAVGEADAASAYMGMCCGADTEFVFVEGSQAHCSKTPRGLPMPLAPVPPGMHWQKVACTCACPRSGTRCFVTWWEVTGSTVDDCICNTCLESLPSAMMAPGHAPMPPIQGRRWQALPVPCTTCGCISCNPAGDGGEPDSDNDPFEDGFAGGEGESVASWLRDCHAGFAIDEHGVPQVQWKEASVDLPWHPTRGGLFSSNKCNCRRVHYDGKNRCHNSINELYRDCSRCDDCRDEEDSCNQPPQQWVRCECQHCGGGTGCNFLVPSLPEELQEEGTLSLCQHCSRPHNRCRHRIRLLGCDCPCEFTAMPSRETEGLPAAENDNAFLGMCCGSNALKKRARAAQEVSNTVVQVATRVNVLAARKRVARPLDRFLAEVANRSVTEKRLSVTDAASMQPRASKLSLLVPPAPPSTPKVASSSLAVASRHYAVQKAQAFTQGNDDMAFKLDGQQVAQLAVAIDEGVLYGVNANTADVDARAWSMWEVVAAMHKTSPLRTAKEAREYPERNAHLLAALMMLAFITCKPRTQGRAFIKPRSALAYPLAIIRVFGRWGVLMPSFKMLQAAVAYLSRLYIAYYGPHSLAPRRAEPMKYAMVLAMFAIPDGEQVGSILWNYDDHDVFMFRVLIVVLWPTAFRLAAIVGNGSNEIFFLTFANLFYSLNKVIVRDPTIAQLKAMRPGDITYLSPPREKPDQWGELHFNFPAAMVFRDEPGNPAKALRDLDLRVRAVGAGRESKPLFHDRQGATYTHAFLDRMLKTVLLFCFGAAVAAVYRWHSWRAGLACALYAAHVDDATIQLVCRWMCPASLHKYRRLGVSGNDALIERAKTATVDSIQSANVPIVQGDHGYAELLASFRGGSEMQADYERALTSREHEEAPRHKRPSKSPVSPPRASAVASIAAARVSATQQPQLASSLQLGAVVILPSSWWPGYKCKENGGRGWSAVILSISNSTAKIEFVAARTTDGRPYAPMRVPINALKAI